MAYVSRGTIGKGLFDAHFQLLGTGLTVLLYLLSEKDKTLKAKTTLAISKGGWKR